MSYERPKTIERFSLGEWIAIVTLVFTIGGGIIGILSNMGILDIRLSRVETNMDTVKDVHTTSEVNKALLQDISKRFESFEERSRNNSERLKEVASDAKVIRANQTVERVSEKASAENP